MTKLAWVRALMIGALVIGAAPTVAQAKPRIDLAAMAQTRVDQAATVYPLIDAQWRGGRGTVDGVCAWSVRWLDAQRDQPLKGKALVAALDAHLARMQDVAAEVTRQVNAGNAPVSDQAIVGYYVAEAQLWVARGK